MSSEPVMQFFLSYHWPGNVRELEHLIEGAMNTIGPDTTLRISHLPPHLLLDQIRDEDPPLHILPAKHAGKAFVEATDIPNAEMAHPDTGVRDLRQQRQEKERKMIDEALTASGGNVSQAARMLNVSRQLIHYKMRKYGLVRQRYRGGVKKGRIG